MSGIAAGLMTAMLWTVHAPPQGACCVGADCHWVTEPQCDSLGGHWLGPDVSCQTAPCYATPGDSCETALEAIEGFNDFDTTSATDSGFGDPDEDACTDDFLDWDQSPDIWFVWVSPGDGLLTLATCDPDSYDTSMVLYRGPDCQSAEQIACSGDGPNDSNCQQYYSLIKDIPVNTSETLWIRLGGWQANVGTGTLKLEFEGEHAAIGGCCIAEDCLVTTEAACITSQGTWLGDHTDCMNDPCDQTDSGACCTYGFCEVIPVQNCIDLGGIPLGMGIDCSGVGCHGASEHVTLHATVLGTNLAEQAAGSWSVDVHAAIPLDWHVIGVDAIDPGRLLMASTEGFFQSIYGGPTSQDINPALYSLVPPLEWDSRVTIGALDQSGDPFDANMMADIGMDWTAFEQGGSLSCSMGSWFCHHSENQTEPIEFIADDCTIRQGVRIARLTCLDRESTLHVGTRLELRDDDQDTHYESAAITAIWNEQVDCNQNRIPDHCDIALGHSEDADANGIPDECDGACEWDLNNDGFTNVDDLLILIGEFDQTYYVDDLLALLAEFNCGT